MRRNTLAVAVTAAALLATVGAPTAMAGGGTVRMVDGDGLASVGDCDGGSTVRKKIQRAIDDASSGDTVIVCPGTYREVVEIGGIDGLTVRASEPWAATIKARTDATTPYIVGIFEADDIVFRGFRVVSKAEAVGVDDCAGAEIGIIAVGTRDVQIRGNRVRATGDTLSECAMFIGILAGFPYGVGSAAGVLPAGIVDDPTTTGLIAYNVVEDYAFIGIASMSTGGTTAGVGDGATDVDIRNNSVRYLHLDEDPGGCDVSASVTAKDRRILRRSLSALSPAGPGTELLCFGIGIYQGAGTYDSPIPGASGIISRNRVFSGPDAYPFPIADKGTPMQSIGILVVDPKHAEGASDVRQNMLHRNYAGIVAVDAKGALVRGNRARGGWVGIAVWDTVAATVRGNRVTQNGIGILAENEPDGGTPAPYYRTRDVQFESNDATGNGEWSCLDETEGDGTEDTDNTWTDNDGEPNSSDPAGICGPNV